MTDGQAVLLLTFNIISAIAIILSYHYDNMTAEF